MIIININYISTIQFTGEGESVCIISDSFEGDGVRLGSERDYDNMENMFKKLGFIVAGQHKS